MSDDWVMVSAVEHWSYCPRQCALIHVEQVFDENIFTLRGRQAHERADSMESTEERGARVERALPIWSQEWRLYGKADAVEFLPDGTPYPVEYKSRKRRDSIHDALQLCAQAVCLEEMFGLPVAEGAIYHIASRRRRVVSITADLREKLAEVLSGIRADLTDSRLPPPVNDKRCPNCSLLDACVPAVIAEARLEWHLRDLYRLPGPGAESDE